MSRDQHIPRWWAELSLIAVVYAAYSGGRLLARGDVSTAVDHGVAILRIERLFSLDFETPLNRLLTEQPWLGIPADFVYASLHYLVTPALLVWIFRRHGAHYRLARTWLMLSTLIGLVGFTLLPTCPPRLLDAAHGFTDTMAQYSGYGWWGAEASAPEGLGGLTNQYAAMPSLHVGWALWCGVVLWRYGSKAPLVRMLAAGYPLLTILVVMGTANHYFLDAVAGAAVMALGYALTRPALRLAHRVRARATARSGTRPVRNGSRVSTRAVGAGCQTSPRDAVAPFPRQVGRDGAPDAFDGRGSRDGHGDPGGEDLDDRDEYRDGHGQPAAAPR